MKKAVLYARYSSNNQREESIDAQVRAIEEYATRNDYEITNRYTDEALTGTSDDRVQFQQMIDDSTKQDWQYVIVHKLDRFARNKYDSAIYKRTLKMNGVRVISVLENLDDSPESVILESVLEGMAEYFSRNLSREVKKGLRENAHLGKLTGGFPPLGYDVDADGHYVINEAEADSVRLMYQWTKEGFGYKAIADRLNTLGRKTKAGRMFSRNSIYDMLRNEKYKGVLVHSKYSRGFMGKWNRDGADNETVLRLPGMVPSIVDLATWTEVNDRLDRSAGRGRSHKKREYLLSGLIICASCGYSMEGCVARDVRAYRCTGKKAGTTHCGASKVNADTVETLVVDLLKKELLNEQAIKDLVPKLTKIATTKCVDTVEDAKIINERIREIDNQTERLVSTIMEMGGSLSIQTKLRELEKEKANLVRTLAETEVEIKVYSSNEEEIAAILLEDMDVLNSNEKASISKVIHRYVLKVTVRFDPNDPPRSGHRRKFFLEIEASLPKTGLKDTPPRGLEPLFSP